MNIINNMPLQESALECVHPSWQDIVLNALMEVDEKFLIQLSSRVDWLPGQTRLLRAFSMPFENTRYLLIGESPYPREESANGYAFWDGAVGSIWSDQGLSKAVNRATSLRNWIKTLLLAEEHLTEDPTKEAIALLDKVQLVQTLDELFQNMQRQGFVLLNASLTLLPDMSVRRQGKHWLPFMDYVLNEVKNHLPDTQLILFGKVAEMITSLPSAKGYRIFSAEHPYNLSFITNREVRAFFKPLKLCERMY